MSYPKHTHLWPENYEEDHAVFWYEMSKESQLKDAILAVQKVKQIVDDLPGGCCWWGDDEWNEHFADFGYIIPFLEELEECFKNRKKNIAPNGNI